MLSIKNTYDYPIVMSTHVGSRSRVVGPIPDTVIEPGKEIVLLPMFGSCRYEEGVSFTFQPQEKA